MTRQLIREYEFPCEVVLTAIDDSRWRVVLRDLGGRILDIDIAVTSTPSTFRTALLKRLKSEF